MNRDTRIRVTITALLLLALPPPAIACGNPAFELLGELAGRWRVFRQDELLGELDMRRMANGCALLEEWHAADGSSAVALHWPGAAPAAALHQAYADSSGRFILAAGEMTDGAIIYEGEAAGGAEILRTTLHGFGSDTVVHAGDVSTDGGVTWRPSGKLTLRRVRAK